LNYTESVIFFIISVSYKIKLPILC